MKNRLLMLPIFLIFFMAIGISGNLYACDTGNCEQDAKQEAKKLSKKKKLTGGYAIFYDAGCSMGYCNSTWAMYSGSEDDGVADTFLGYYGCDSWSDYCWNHDICPQCLFGCDEQGTCKNPGGGSGGEGGPGEGNDGGTCYIGPTDFCPVECRTCVRVPYAQ